MHANTVAVRDAAAALGFVIEPITYPAGTRTAEDAAIAVGCDVAQIVKSLVFSVDDELVVALVSGANRLDEGRLAAAAGGSACRRVDAETVRAATGFPIGGVPPFGHVTPLRVFVDADLLGHAVVWAAAGTPSAVFSITPERLVEATGGEVTALRAG